MQVILSSLTICWIHQLVDPSIVDWSHTFHILSIQPISFFFLRLREGSKLANLILTHSFPDIPSLPVGYKTKTLSCLPLKMQSQSSYLYGSMTLLLVAFGGASVRLSLAVSQFPQPELQSPLLLLIVCFLSAFGLINLAFAIPGPAFVLPDPSFICLTNPVHYSWTSFHHPWVNFFHIL